MFIHLLCLIYNCSSYPLLRLSTYALSISQTSHFTSPALSYPDSTYPRQIPIVLRATPTPLPRNILLLWWNEFRDICGQRQLFINSLKNFFQVNFYQPLNSTLSNPPFVPSFCTIPCLYFSPLPSPFPPSHSTLTLHLLPIAH